MFNFTIFGGAEVKLDGGSKFILTMFGATEVHKPTLAKRIMQEKQLLEAEKQTSNHSPDNVNKMINPFTGSPDPNPAHSPRRRHTFILTIFGAAEIKPPSLAEEFMDMRELVSSGLVSESDWEELTGRLYQMGDLEGISTFTLFGAMEQATLSEEEELKKIKSASELGLFDSEEEIALRSVVGRDPQQVRMLLRQTAFAHPT